MRKYKTYKYKIWEIVRTQLTPTQWENLRKKWIAERTIKSRSTLYRWMGIQKGDKTEIIHSALLLISKDLSEATGIDYTPENLNSELTPLTNP